MTTLDVLARGAAALLLALTGCATVPYRHASVPSLVDAGHLYAACRVLTHCDGAPNDCPELSRPEPRQAARATLLRAIAVREQLTARLDLLGREALSQRLGFEAAPSFAERGLTLGLTVTSRAPDGHTEVQDFDVEGMPESLFAGDDVEALERYVAALGGPRRPPFVPSPGQLPALVKLLAHAATAGVFLMFERLGGPPLAPDASYVDATGRRVDWMSWGQLPEVRAAAALRQPRWTLHGDKNVPVPGAGSVTLTRGYTFLPWRDAAAQGTDHYQYAWEVPTGAPRAVAIAPAGWIAVMSRSFLEVLDGESGRHIASSGQLCEVVDDGLFLVTPTRGIVVCRDALAELGFPTMKLGATAPMPFEAEVAALAGDLVAVGGGRHVELHRTTSLARIEAIELPVAVSSLALSADGQRLAIGGEDGSTRIRLVGGGPELLRQGDRKSRVRGLAFSPNGRRLFVADAAFTAHELDVTTGKPHGPHHRTGSWLTATRYLADDLVATTGSDGLQLYSTTTMSARELVTPRTLSFPGARALGVSPDARMVCSDNRIDRMICHTRGPLGPSTLFDEWKPDAPRALVVELRFALPGDDDTCTIDGAFRLDMPAAASPQEAIATLAARGEIPLASADHAWSGYVETIRRRPRAPDFGSP